MEADRQLNHGAYKMLPQTILFNSAVPEHRLWPEYFDIFQYIHKYSK